MPELKKVRVFIASPGDVQIERTRVAQAVHELNQTVGVANDLVLEVVTWEKNARPEMGRIQGVINKQIGEYDIFVGMMWCRFGTPSGESGSGTEEEFNRAFSSWERTKSPKILLYFSEALTAPPKTVDEARQMLKVAEFRAEVEGKGLTWTYTKPEAFDDVVRPHLHGLILDEFCSRPKPLTRPLDPKLRSLLEIEKNICRETNSAYHSANLILTMIDTIPGSLTKKAFEAVNPGCCKLINERLSFFLKNHQASRNHPFKDFEWEDRHEVQGAQRQAGKDGSLCILEKHLLLSLLHSEGRTITKLKDSLFPGDHFKLLLNHIDGVTKVTPEDEYLTLDAPSFSFRPPEPSEE
jgi:hypothetical protein